MELYSGRREPRGRMCRQMHFFTKSLNVGLSLSLRYIGEGYSQAQESMEDEMREFYGLKQSTSSPLQSPSSGQLVAVRAEEEEEILRAQVCEVMVDKVKVRDQGKAGHDSLSVDNRHITVSIVMPLLDVQDMEFFRVSCLVRTMCFSRCCSRS